jgi:hypothetical protein
MIQAFIIFLVVGWSISLFCFLCVATWRGLCAVVGRPRP